MAWEPNDHEITSVLKLESTERYSYFVKRVADHQGLWSLWGNGWVLTSDDRGHELIPVWPHSKYAVLCAGGKWEGNVPKLIELETWMNCWVDGAKRDGRLVAVFPTPGNRGVAVEPDRLASDLELELANYGPRNV